MSDSAVTREQVALYPPTVSSYLPTSRTARRASRLLSGNVVEEDSHGVETVKLLATGELVPRLLGASILRTAGLGVTGTASSSESERSDFSANALWEQCWESLPHR